MEKKNLELLAVDCVSLNEFILYFSDQTYITVSAEELGRAFPNRLPIPNSEMETDS